MDIATYPSLPAAAAQGETRRPLRQRALVVGLGIAGLASATRLAQIGWDVVVVERAATRRGGGYMIGLFGIGQAAAQRMGLLGALENRFTTSMTAYEVDRQGQRRPGMSFAQAPGTPHLLLRGDVEQALFAALPAEIELRFASSPVAVEQNEAGVRVTLRDSSDGSTSTERYDLVVGADGVHSTVRRLVFGPDAEYVKSLDHMVAATILATPPAGFRSTDGVVLVEPGRSAWVFAFANHAPALMMSYRSDNPEAERQRPPADALREAFGPEPLGPVLDELITQYEEAPDKLFDTALQVQMPAWHAGRVVLIGDAAWCMTLYSGMGVSLGLAGADLLATRLAEQPDDLPQALAAWEAQLRPYVAHFQEEAQTTGLNLFVPQDQKTIRKRSLMFRLNRLPLVGAILSKLSKRSPDTRMRTADLAAA